ncbi:hypothetical protein [Trichloromonas sp.]|uniref:hypothetical protein n=1 Tax=Trichloromonas sp. TaxID=3069249 RepID=UPI003D819C49
MEFPVEDILNRHIAMGVFALYVVIVSLLRVMAEQEFFRLTALKKIWGRTRGLTIHFISNVALPLVFAIVFLSQGIAALSAPERINENTSLPLTPAAYILLAQEGQGPAESLASVSAPFSLCPRSHPLEILPP